MTLKSKSKVYRLNKKSRVELGCAIMTLKSKEQGLWNVKKERNGAGMSNNDPKE